MVAPLIVRGLSAAALAAKVALKAKRAKKVADRAKAAKKAVTKKKKPTNFKSQESKLKAENKGDERTVGRIKRLKEQNDSGLISDGERQRALTRLTKEHRSRAGHRVNPGE